MKKMIIPAIALLLSSLLTTTLPAWAGHGTPAAQGQDKMGGMDMGSTKDKTIMLESVQQDGVMAMAHLYDLGEPMAKQGMKDTHHMMVMFTEMKDSKPITEGIAAVKIVDPAGVKGEPIKLMLMGDGFGANIALPAAGKYTLEVGTKLADTKKRVFTFTFVKK